MCVRQGTVGGVGKSGKNVVACAGRQAEERTACWPHAGWGWMNVAFVLSYGMAQHGTEHTTTEGEDPAGDNLMESHSSRLAA